MHIEANSLDDLLQEIFRRLLNGRNKICPSKGPAREIVGSLLTLREPLARFSRTESRATLFSCLGELLWYLSGSDDLGFIKYYIPAYTNFSDDGVTINGAYGPRIFRPIGTSQWERVDKLLREKPDSRQAVIQVFDADDITKETKDVPCTCTIQFLARRRKLHMLTSMRSNDAYLGLPHDVFSFTMLQEIMARSLGLEVGTYKHAVGSLHLYDQDRPNAEAYLSEGWQTQMAMPAMPTGDLWPSIGWLSTVEQSIRGGDLTPITANGVDPYWIDLARILRIKALLSAGRRREAVVEKRSMASKVYDAFIRRKENAIGPSPQLSLPGLNDPLGDTSLEGDR